MRLTGLMALGGLTLGMAALPAFAHGGGHATPWPTPTTSTYSYTPQTYFPTYVPSVPSPTTTTTTPTTPSNPGTIPTSPTPGAPTGSPTGPTGPTSGGSGPNGPSTPGGPTSGGPAAPTGPTNGPTGPTSTPSGPSGPSAPAGPTGVPTGPSAPSAPTSGPTGPTAPGGPASGPTGPSGPGGGGPTSPQSPQSPGSGLGSPTAPQQPGGPTGPASPQPGPGGPSTAPGPGGYPTGPTSGTGSHPGNPGAPNAPSGPNRPGTGSRPGGAPIPHGGPSKGEVDRQAKERREHWEAWWQQNQWVHLRADQRKATLTGSPSGGADPATALATWLRTVALADENFDPRSAAAIALGKLHALDAAKQLNALMLNDKNGFVRESSALALGMMQSTGSSPRLVQVLGNRRNDDRLRMHAAIGLGLMQDPSAVPALVRLLAGGDQSQVMVAATMALGLIGDDSATTVLIRLAGSRRGNSAVRSTAIGALGKLSAHGKQRENILGLLRKIYAGDTDAQARRAAALVLHRFDAPGIIDDLIRVGTNDRDRVVRGFTLLSLAEAVHAHGDAGDRDRARALLGHRLRAGTDVEKGYAAIALGLLGRSDRGCAAPLREALRLQSNESNLAAVCIGLGLMQDIGSRQAIGAIAGGQGQADLRGYACVALGLMGHSDARITTFLTQIVEHANVPEVKAAAALALSKIGSTPEALATLRKAIHDRNRYFKMSAIVALGYFRDFGTVDDLQQCFGRENTGETRAMAVVALGYIGESADLPVLRSLSVDFNYLALFQTMPDMDQLLQLF